MTMAFQIHDFGDGHAAPGQSQQILDDRCPPQAGLEDVVGVPPQGISFGNLLQEHLGVSDQNPQDIVEVMGYSSGQGPEGFHLLGASQALLQPLLLAFGPLPVRNVAAEGKNPFFAVFFHDRWALISTGIAAP